MSRPFKIYFSLAVLLIFLTALMQGLGFCPQMERGLAYLLPEHLRPEPPRMILLSLESGPQGFSALDVAMALRGLGQFHPECILVNGKIEPEKGSVPLLPGIISSLINKTDITLILPESPSPEARFRRTPLVRFTFWANENTWPVLAGKCGTGTGAAYLPDNQETKENLSLLASSSDGSTIGSLWWWGLPLQVRKHPPLLLCDTILLLANHSLLRMTPSGEVPLSTEGGTFREIPLDDFLLQIEQKERGVISPAFDTLWKNATVVLGTHSDTATISDFASLLREVSAKRPSLRIQMLMALGWIMLFILIKNGRSGIQSLPRWLLPLLIVLIVIFTTLFLMHQGFMIPFLPGIITALLLLLYKSNKG